VPETGGGGDAGAGGAKGVERTSHGDTWDVAGRGGELRRKMLEWGFVLPGEELTERESALFSQLVAKSSTSRFAPGGWVGVGWRVVGWVDVGGREGWREGECQCQCQWRGDH